MRKSRLCGILLMCILTAAKPAMAVSAEEIPAAAPRETVSVTEEESEIENVSEDADGSSNADLSNEDRAEETLSETGGTDHDALAQDPVEDSSGKAEDEADPAAPSGSEAVSGTEDIEDPEAVSDTKDIEEPEAVSDAEGAENPEAVSGTEGVENPEAVSGTEDVDDPEAVSDTEDIVDPEEASSTEGSEAPEAVSDIRKISVNW